MATKLDLDEDFIVKEYLSGKSSLVLEKELGISKPLILKILNKNGVVKKRDRCKSLNIIKENERYSVIKKCDKCNSEIKISSDNPTIACRNYFNSIKKKSICKKCSLKLQLGSGNPFYGKKHTKETKQKISESRKGKSTGKNNPMSNPKWREKARQNLKFKWDNGEMEHARKIMSDKLKQTRKLGKIKSVIRSKKEKEIVNEIKKLGYKVEHSLRVDSKICDIYIPKLNLVIEYNGDYWHCNPKKYNEDYYHQIKGKTAKELWEYDKYKIDLIRDNGYNLEIVWESDLKKDQTIINKLIKKYDKR